MKEIHKCEQYLHIFLKLPQTGFKLHYWINKLIDKYVVLFLTYFSSEFLFSSGSHEVIAFYKIIALTTQPYAIGRSYVTFAVFNSIFTRRRFHLSLSYCQKLQGLFYSCIKNWRTVAVRKFNMTVASSKLIKVLLHVFYFGGSLCTQSKKSLPSLEWSYLHFFQLRFDSITYRHHTTIACRT